MHEGVLIPEQKTHKQILLVRYLLKYLMLLAEIYNRLKVRVLLETPLREVISRRCRTEGGSGALGNPQDDGPARFPSDVSA